LNFTSRTVFGVNPDELGSPWVAAFSSLALFSVGALVPLLPWFFGHGDAAVAWSVVLTWNRQLAWWPRRWSAGNSAVRGGRQLLIVVLASAVTYGIGNLFGTVIS
jgi:VIT1/CCC1 family predicted Fe2+/Mn2+ transporter